MFFKYLCIHVHWTKVGSALKGLKGVTGMPANTHICAVVAEDSHHADRDELSTCSTESPAPQSEDERHVVLTTDIYDVVQSIVQATCNETNAKSVSHNSCKSEY